MLAMPSQDSLRARALRTAARALKPFQLARFPLVRRLYRSAFRAAVPPGEVTEVGVREARMFVDPHDGGVGYQLVIGRGYETLTSELFERELAPGMVVVDLGANIGYYSLLAAARIGAEGQVFAFEPAPENIALFERSIAANRFEQVTLVPKACSDVTGPVQLHLSQAGKGLHTIGTPGDGWAAIEVECVRLDDFFVGAELEIDLMKIDIEGAEMRALDGMQRILAGSRKLRILTEVNPTALSANATDAEAYIRRLMGQGFEINAVVDEAAGEVLRPDLAELLRMCARRPLEVKHWNCNVLFARRGPV
jgi:FkbM family methyltransferase